MNRKPALPVDSILPEVLAILQHTPNLVIEAPPGTGKTTRVRQPLSVESESRQQERLASQEIPFHFSYGIFGDQCALRLTADVRFLTKAASSVIGRLQI